MPRLSRPTTLALAGAGVCLLVFSLLAIAVVSGGTDAFDQIVRAEIHGWASPALTSTVRTITWLGSVVVIVTLSLASTVGLGIMHRWNDAIVLAYTTAGVMTLNPVLKLIFHQTRPASYFGDVLDTYSFPSGHSAYSCCFYFTIAALVAAHTKRTSVRGLAFGIAAIIVAAVGFSRVYLGVHWPADVLGGYLVGLFVIAISQAFAVHEKTPAGP